jgi:hypothetical protein
VSAVGDELQAAACSSSSTSIAASPAHLQQQQQQGQQKYVNAALFVCQIVALIWHPTGYIITQLTELTAFSPIMPECGTLAAPLLPNGQHHAAQWEASSTSITAT